MRLSTPLFPDDEFMRIYELLLLINANTYQYHSGVTEELS